MNQTSLFGYVLSQAWKITWRYKTWWLVGFFALFLASTLGYQLFFQAIAGIADPGLWWQRWTAWSQGITLTGFLSGQWGVLLSDPKSWVIMLGAWIIILSVLLVIFGLSVYAVSVLISHVKIQEEAGQSVNPFFSLREATFHFWPLFWAILLVQLVSNVLVLLFSIPILVFGQPGAGPESTFVLFLFFFLFLVAIFLLSAITMFTILGIVMEDAKLSAAIVRAWALVKRYWVITLEMFVLQFLVAIGFAFMLFLLIGLVTIPLAIIGFILVSNQIYDLTSILPVLSLAVLILITLVAGAVFTVFHLSSWSYFFLRIEGIHPKSRLADFIEIHILNSAS